MAIGTLKTLVDEEVSAILSSDFEITVAGTSVVPHSGDSGITFPNLDSSKQSCKVIETCLLYIDIRRSTELNLTKRPATVAKLYSAFVRAMTNCAIEFDGHVRGIIGDRLMVLFDVENSFVRAVDCAIAMNSTAQHVINKHFKAGEFTCGIGIDHGKMLVTKTGIRKRGADLHNYKNLVWLGRPANLASKLTDLANKDAEQVAIKEAHLAFGHYPNWRWITRSLEWFAENLSLTHGERRLNQNNDPTYEAFFLSETMVTTRAKTPSILMTKTVWDECKKAQPNRDYVTNPWFTAVRVKLPGGTEEVIGGDVVFVAFK